MLLFLLKRGTLKKYVFSFVLKAFRPILDPPFPKRMQRYDYFNGFPISICKFL